MISLSKISCAVLLARFLSPAACHAQISFTDAIHLAVENSPRVKSAQNDVAKAEAGIAVVKDIYIPSVVVGGGAGYAYGITLTVPTVFTVNAQSLVFSFQQRSYLHAAHLDLDAANFALAEAKQQTEEDAAITYVSLAAARDEAAARADEYEIAARLGVIMQDRLHASLDSELEVAKYKKGEIQIKLAKMESDDNVEDLQAHLSQLTGIAPDQLKIVPETIPAISLTGPSDSHQLFPDTPGIQAAAANDRARSQRARGDAQYTWRPQIGFGGGYGRVSPIENVSEFYNLHGIYNTYSVGVSVQFPILDLVRKSAARESKLDASRSELDLDSLRADETAGRHKLQRAVPELATRSELADVEEEIAQQQLKSVQIASQQSTGVAPVTPKDVENARIDEREKFVQMLDAKLEARKAQIKFLRLTGQLDGWLSHISIEGQRSLTHANPIP